jgi:restriction endonuclease S subunit
MRIRSKVGKNKDRFNFIDYVICDMNYNLRNQKLKKCHNLFIFLIKEEKMLLVGEIY